MNILFAIIEGTFREAFAKRTLVGFFILSSVLILITFLIFQNPVVVESVQKTREPSAADLAAGILNTTVLDVVWTTISVVFFIFTMCMGIFASAGFITSIMEKGTIDLLLSKPVHRWQYLIGRYAGGLAVIFVEVVWFIFGIWVVISLSTGIWNTGFLFSIIHLMIAFAGLYSVSMLIGVLFRSSLLSIIATIGLAFVSMLVSLSRWASTVIETPKTIWTYLGDGFYYIFPQVSDMAQNMAYTIIGKSINVGVIVLTLALTFTYLLVSVIVFNKKEF
jgi:ABC-type transport system involved in multi-copper enzyme maturation permease subunit